jgi:hypothetical protein
MSQESGAPPLAPHRSRLGPGRRAGLFVVGLLFVALSTLCTVQIVKAVWFPEYRAVEAPCRSAVLGLVAAVQRARERAAAEGPEGERAALIRFRSALEPEWSKLAGVRRACREDDKALRALRTVELLRYAEERAVRYEALGLSPLRQRALSLQRELGPSFTSAPPPPDTL